MQTSYLDSYSFFSKRSEEFVRRVAAWESNPHYSLVVPFVKSHVTSYLYQITPAEHQDVCERTEHALGNISKEEIDRVLCVRDWHPPFAFIHLFHYIIEKYGLLPTYQDFVRLCKEDSFLVENFAKPSEEIVEQAVSLGIDRKIASDAVQWRIGNAYYSMLRETHTVVYLKEYGLQASYHLLPDAVAAVDAWAGDVIVSLFVLNSTYKEVGGGRKLTAEEIFSDASPPFRFLNIRMDPKLKNQKFGVVHLPCISAIGGAVSKLARS